MELFATRKGHAVNRRAFGSVRTAEWKKDGSLEINFTNGEHDCRLFLDTNTQEVIRAHFVEKDAAEYEGRKLRANKEYGPLAQTNVSGPCMCSSCVKIRSDDFRPTDAVTLPRLPFKDND